MRNNEKKYRLLKRNSNIFSIAIFRDPHSCFVRALDASLAPKQFIKGCVLMMSFKCTEPMTLVQARAQIKERGREAIGSEVQKCLGLCLEEEGIKTIRFEEPIVFERKKSEFSK
ncbi:MAG: hypothetical protein OEV93_04285 [Candidatus Moranbacteria bacterium]|nr:hypothetical protein [Candidatus Moranbacteria bacterium]